MVNEFSKGTYDTGVGTTAETLIGSEGNHEDLGVGGALNSTSHHVGVTLEHHVEGLVTEVFAFLETIQVTLHLGSGDHLHSLGDLTDGGD